MSNRLVTFALLYIAYVTYYICRKNYGFWMHGFITNLDFKKSEISLAGSSFEITSGIAKIGLAVLVDKYSPSKILAISLILSAFINLLLCATENIYIISFLCGTNGALQSLGWPSLSNIFMNFFPEPSERGRWYSFLSTNQNVGSFAPAIILPFVMNRYGWKASMWFPSLIGFVIGIILLIFLKDTPTATVAGNDNNNNNNIKMPKKTTAKKEKISIWNDIFCNKGLWFLAMCYFGISIIRTSTEDWAPMYMKEIHDESPEKVLIALQIGGLLGSFVAAWLSDVIYKGLRAPVIATFCLLSFFPLYLLSFTKAEITSFTNNSNISSLIDYLPICAYFFLGLTLFAPHVLIGLAAREWAPKEYYSTSGGFVKCFAQIGGSFAGAPVAFLIEKQGWQNTFGYLSYLSIIGFIILIPVWSLSSYKNNKMIVVATEGVQKKKKNM